MTEPPSDADRGLERIGPPEVLDGPVVLVEHRDEWSATSEREVAGVRRLLGERVLLLEHVGSTSVPGLVAKPIVDLVLVVADTDEESAYLSDLESLGLTLRFREPRWHRHRLLKRPEPAINLHVFPAGCVEPERMIRFRDHLRHDAADRQLYAWTKRELAARTWARTQDYADAKTAVVEEILRRVGAPSAADDCP